MLKRVASAWLHGLAATTIGLLFLAVSPGSPVTSKAVEFTAVVLDFPERPAVWARHLASEGFLWFGGMREMKEKVRQLELENTRLRSAIQERPDLRVPVASDLIPVRIDVRPPDGWWSEVRIDKGSSEGIREGMPALQDGFLAGRVSRVHDSHSWVELLTSTTLFVPVVIDDTRDLGVMAGDGEGGINLLYISGEKEIRQGMRISTAMVSDVLPPGIPVGEISGREPEPESGFIVYHVKPGADLSVMYSLYILSEGGQR